MWAFAEPQEKYANPMDSLGKMVCFSSACVFLRWLEALVQVQTAFGLQTDSSSGITIPSPWTTPVLGMLPLSGQHGSETDALWGSSLEVLAA